MKKLQETKDYYAKRRQLQAYKIARYKQKNKKYFQPESSTFQYKPKEKMKKKQGICPYCGKVYQNKYNI
ncbi:MAG: hypothetical protein ACYCUI_15690 [Vulcanimicrobiaceae bacterium]